LLIEGMEDFDGVREEEEEGEKDEDSEADYSIILYSTKRK